MKICVFMFMKLSFEDYKMDLLHGHPYLTNPVGQIGTSFRLGNHEPATRR